MEKKAMLHMRKRIVIIMVSLACLIKMNAQIGPNPYAGAAYYYDFGQGDANPAAIGPQLPAGMTSYQYSTDLCPKSGYYTIASHVNTQSCYNNSWVQIVTDHTPNGGTGLGMGMIFKTDSHLPIVFEDTVRKTLCPNQVYEFSAAILNLIDKTYCPGSLQIPIFRLQVESDAGTTIAFKDYSVPSYYPDPPYNTPWWRSPGYSVDFTMPANVNRLVIKVIVASSYAGCADAFALDDIAITATGPTAAIQFLNEPNTLVKSVCFQQNTQISMSGTMGSFYPNPALQWQQSTDSGKYWTDIPGATQNIYSANFSTPDTFFFRLTGSDASLIANPNCRVVSNNIEVNVDGLPSGYKINNNSPVCSGHDIQFDVNGDESGYIWTGPNGFYDNSPHPHIYHSKIADSGIYYVQIFSQGGCEKTDSVHIVVIGTDVNVGPIDTSICAGNSVQLNVTGGIQYIWQPAQSLNAATIQDPVAVPASTTRYSVTVYDKSGCSDTASALIQVKNTIPVKAMIGGSDYLCPRFDSVFFKDMSSGEISKWSWDFGNGKTDTIADPPAQYYSSSGSQVGFTVKLTVGDSSGCMDSANHPLSVVPNCYITVPSAFTPNHDGKNDYLYPLNAYKASNLIFKIFNRNGQLLFEGRSITNKWDGSFGGAPQPAGTYVWMLEYTDEKKERISLKGTTVLIR
jgi:gliding motility-associated-like protein